MADLIEILQSKDASAGKRAQAAYDLGRKAQRGDTKLVSAAIAVLLDAENDVRREAVFAVGRAASVGDPMALDALLKALCDSSDVVRQQAADALRWIAPRADSRTVSALRTAVQKDSAAGVRRDAAHALSEVAARGDAETAKVLLGRLADNDESEDVRDFVSYALGAVATLQDVDAISAILCRLFRGPSSRQVAGEALSRLFDCPESEPALAVFWAAVDRDERRIEEFQALLAEENDVEAREHEPDKCKADHKSTSGDRGRSRSPRRSPANA
eukprot:gnl/TRDRNA2_/TRDRNA2_158540_c0_seq2.p1 gnl/TRDRNA2_/TRDRNA2_158540_c0~~gnl/TRDRNA2_/TRDRNA2_158540_c0_seq2.p1  ORF type:complete len:272 (-),score=47.89 gnl/TRDRNA2_/TRDRNA2_158540_c0_seq2:15-830(-)